MDRVERASPDVLFSGPADRKVVALTIDDGPAERTGAILDALAENGARATFFLIGSRVEKRPDVVRRIGASMPVATMASMTYPGGNTTS